MKNELIRDCLILSMLFIILALILFSQISFWFLGMGIAVIGFIILYLTNQKDD